MTKEEIREELLTSVNAYKNGARDREYVKDQVNYYYTAYRYMGGQEIIDMINEIDKERQKDGKISAISEPINRYNKYAFISEPINSYDNNSNDLRIKNHVLTNCNDNGNGKDNDIDIGMDAKSKKILAVIGILFLVLFIVVSMFTGTEKTNLKSDATSTEGKKVRHEKRWDSDNDGLSDDFEAEQGTDPNDYTWNFELDN